MEFRVRFFQTESGEQPIAELLEELKTRNPKLRIDILAGLRKLQNRSYHRPPLSELVDSKNQIFEMRIGDMNIARVFFFFQPGQEIIVTNGYVKKQQKLDKRALARAQRYKEDWEKRQQ